MVGEFCEQRKEGRQACEGLPTLKTSKLLHLAALVLEAQRSGRIHVTTLFVTRYEPER